MKKLLEIQIFAIVLINWQSGTTAKKSEIKIIFILNF